MHLILDVLARQKAMQRLMPNWCRNGFTNYFCVILLSNDLLSFFLIIFLGFCFVPFCAVSNVWGYLGPSLFSFVSFFIAKCFYILLLCSLDFKCLNNSAFRFLAESGLWAVSGAHFCSFLLFWALACSFLISFLLFWCMLDNSRFFQWFLIDLGPFFDQFWSQNGVKMCFKIDYFFKVFFGRFFQGFFFWSISMHLLPF